jgi:predicted GNAT family N-acyltransferase
MEGGVFSQEVVAQQVLSDREIDEIARLKMQSWRYSYTSQVHWIREKTAPTDRHVMLRRNGVLCAYLRLTERCIVAPVGLPVVLGVSTVCVDETMRRAGVGRRLMATARDVILDANAIGLLCCGERLVPFYESCDWRRLRSSVGKETFPDDDFFAESYVMAYRLAIDPPRIVVSGDSF